MNGRKEMSVLNNKKKNFPKSENNDDSSPQKILHKIIQMLLKMLSLYEGYCNIYSSQLKHPEISERNCLSIFIILLSE